MTQSTSEVALALRAHLGENVGAANPWDGLVRSNAFEPIDRGRHELVAPDEIENVLRRGHTALIGTPAQLLVKIWGHVDLETCHEPDPSTRVIVKKWFGL